MLEKENRNLEIAIQRFKKGNKILDQMVHSNVSFNHEGLGYNKSSPPGRDDHHIQQGFVAPKPPSQRCYYCNKDGHNYRNCKYRNSEIKGKFIWVRK